MDPTEPQHSPNHEPDSHSSPLSSTIADSLKFPPPTSLSSPINSHEKYVQLASEALKENFWLQEALKEMNWITKPTKGLEGDFREGNISFFGDGEINISYNCLDRHPPTDVALIWEPDSPTSTLFKLTYGQLLESTCQLSHFLLEQGAKKGDRVTIYMPMIPETVVAMLACARLGLIHNVVFAGFSAESLSERILDSSSSIILTAEEGFRGGKHLHLRTIVSRALEIACSTDNDNKYNVLLLEPGTGFTSTLKRPIASEPKPSLEALSSQRVKYHSWIDSLEKQEKWIAPTAVKSEDPLFMLYTSGSTGKPKGLVHSSAGYLLYALKTCQWTFDLGGRSPKDDIHGCLADVGWITGHTYIVYGPMALGVTTVLFEGTPLYPDASRYWEVVEKHRLTTLYTAPTVIRALKKEGSKPLKGKDLSSLRVLGTVGEPINPDAWLWWRDVVGGGGGGCSKLPIVDTYWQTETGGHVVTPLPFATTTKPGSACLPVPGQEVVVLDQQTGDRLTEPATQGVLALARPWPGMARTIWGDHQKFLRTYLLPYPGHYFSGDRVERDEDGYLWIRGRVDDVINVSGHRLSTGEIEAVLGRHPLCTEAAVLAKPDDITGQAVWAFCIMKEHSCDDGDVSGVGGVGDESFNNNTTTATTATTTAINNSTVEKEMIALVRGAIGALAAPKKILLVSDLPKTRSGKIMRRILRKILEGCKDPSELGDISTLLNPPVVQEIIELVHGK